MANCNMAVEVTAKVAVGISIKAVIRAATKAATGAATKMAVRTTIRADQAYYNIEYWLAVSIISSWLFSQLSVI
jgi:hypothetical protein